MLHGIFQVAKGNFEAGEEPADASACVRVLCVTLKMTGALLISSAGGKGAGRCGGGTREVRALTCTDDRERSGSAGMWYIFVGVKGVSN